MRNTSDDDGAEAAPPADAAAGPAGPGGAPRVVNIVKSYAGVCERGYSASQPDKPCQDATVMEEDAASGAVLLAVFDGHGEDGHFVAQAFADALPAAVFAHRKFAAVVPVADNVAPPPTDDAEVDALADKATKQSFRASAAPPVAPPVPRRDVAGALVGALAAVEKSVLARRDIDCSLSGCTGVVAVVCGDHVTVANVGDSRAVLVRTAAVPAAAAAAAAAADGGGDGPTLRLVPAPVTVDHKPTLPTETRRILLAGGRVHAIRYADGVEGPVRVWCRDDDVPGLAMSRSLGDTVGKRAGVSSTPDVYTYTLTDADAFIVVASDGLWEFTTPGDVADVLADTAAEARLQALAFEAAAADAAAAGDPPPPPPMMHLQLALDALGTVAVQRWHEREGYVDDLSIIIAEIGRDGGGGGEGGGGEGGGGA
jgi:serine/threonine protein phosphatase PrpC